MEMRIPFTKWIVNVTNPFVGIALGLALIGFWGAIVYWALLGSYEYAQLLGPAVLIALAFVVEIKGTYYRDHDAFEYTHTYAIIQHTAIRNAVVAILFILSIGYHFSI